MRISDWSSDGCSSGLEPCDSLKEKRRGSISEMVKPLTGQANFSEKTMRLSGMPAFFIWPPSALGEGPGVGEASGDAVLPHPNPSPEGEGLWSASATLASTRST